MADSNKVIIKINYQGADKKLRKQLRPEMVTAWNVRRILFALIMLIAFILFPLYYFSAGSSDSEKKEVFSVKHNDTNIKTDAKFSAKAANNEIIITDIKSIDNTEVVKKSDIKITEKIAEKESPVTGIKTIDNIKKGIKMDGGLSVNTVKKESPVTDIKSVNKIKTEDIHLAKSKTSSNVLTDARVTRAMLATGISNKEPLANMSLPVIVDKNNAVAVYYFTEIINMKGETLYHHWLRDGLSIYKKKINILGDRWRASTSKLIPYSKVGLWQVRLVNDDGIVLNKIQFNVIKEQ